MFQHIVEIDWLYARLNDGNIKIVDCRFYLGDSEKGYEEYRQEHIPGAVYADLEKHLSAPVQKYGGRHPLPDISQFTRFLEGAGIGNDTIVVAYDSQAGAMASRFWWLMKYVGHEHVYVLNGGFPAWKRSLYPVSSETPLLQSSVYHPAVNSSLLAVMEEVRTSINSDSVVILDSREAKRYAGIEEPIDKAAGHIPGAVNRFWREALDEQGKWKALEELKELFANTDLHKQIIVYCGSGITACPNVLALMEIGITDVKLYAGSWSDWISYKENPITDAAD